jgi:hypothetical protein
LQIKIVCLYREQYDRYFEICILVKWLN